MRSGTKEVQTMWSKLKFFGHPIHPMLVAYPIAANVAGVGMAVVAALPGFLDWLLGIPKEADAKRTGLIHGLLNVGALTAFAITLGIYAGDWNATALPGAAAGIVIAG